MFCAERSDKMILDDLYIGNISPAENAVAGNPEFLKLNRQVLAALKNLEENLNADQMALVNQFHSRINDLRCCETAANFKYGFTLGGLLMQEIFSSSLNQTCHS